MQIKQQKSDKTNSEHHSKNITNPKKESPSQCQHFPAFPSSADLRWCQNQTEQRQYSPSQFNQVNKGFKITKPHMVDPPLLDAAGIPASTFQLRLCDIIAQEGKTKGEGKNSLLCTARAILPRNEERKLAKAYRLDKNIVQHKSFHFSHIALVIRRIIILMSFSNYANPFYSNSFCLEPAFLPYSCFLLPAPLPLVSFEDCSPSIVETRNQREQSGSILQRIEERLKAVHFESQHHKKTHWSAEEDRLLSKLVEVQKLQWKDLPSHFEGRTQNMCYSRYRRISMSARDRSWSSGEEELLVAYVHKFGQKWKLISSKMPKFTPKQIRERFLNYLRPSIRKDDFQLQEDLEICKFVLEQGKHWRKMEEVLPGRPEGCIKGRYYGKLQKIIEAALNEAI